MDDTAEDETTAAIVRLCGEGDSCVADRRYDEGIAHYRQALGLLPLPVESWEASTFLFLAIGNAHFLSGELDAASSALRQALRCPSGVLDAQIHLRLGQILLAWDQEEPAAIELALAYMAGGSAIFADEDPRCLALVQSVLRPPADGVW